MQVSVETTQGPERRMTVSVPAERIESEIQNRLMNLSRTVKLKGFRPGKVPFKVMENRYGPSVRSDVLNDITRTTFYEAISSQNLKLAGFPRFQQRVAEPGRDLEYEAVFEVLEKVMLAPLSGVDIARPVAEITEQDVDTMVGNLRRQRAEAVPVERAAREGDRVTVSGTIDGQPFLGEREKEIVIGAGVFPDLEQAMVGTARGDARVLDLRFPEDYPVRLMAGRTAHFELKVETVAEFRLPEVNEEFIRSFDIQDGTLESFRQELRRTMQDEMAEAISSKIKARALEALLSQNPIEAPRSQVEQQAELMMEQARQTLLGQGVPASEIKLNQPSFETEAKRRVQIGLLVSEIVREQRFRVGPEQVRARVESLASSYENPAEAIQWYYADRNRISSVEQLVLEDQVVDWIMGQARVTEEKTGFAALLRERRTL
ncbi:MAG: trigger factor [Gammaproteobacteria bacterium]|nr:trigger factor [Gammaproteobacteria bacterium]